jgi:membrane-bound ClpP family serine protease
MPEQDKPTIVERLILQVVRQIFGGVAKSAERFVKRSIRWLSLALAGVVVAILGVGFLAVGAVKWFALIMPGWLAWTIVGIILLLLGLVLTLATLASSRG